MRLFRVCNIQFENGISPTIPGYHFEMPPIVVATFRLPSPFHLPTFILLSFFCDPCINFDKKAFLMKEQ
ncbi:hypothetical protein KK060_13620 [Fulvivirgaceae bacterium PWU20]|uniref:Uncharacterized protein n=1 Tax=Chryseosolibacter indicus TaxID=2782351 RepID=A0ABS5VSC8_9BACT|nr:hypothetical protein [Chryseosolibacter indicus]